MIKQSIIKVYGPYISKSIGRRFVLLILADGTRRLQAYSRFLWEAEHGPIPEGMEVDHIDEDCLNDVIGNYQLLTKRENIEKSVRASGKTVEIFRGVCPECGSDFEKKARDVRHNRKQGKPGPFCSRRCSGKANRRLQ